MRKFFPLLVFTLVLLFTMIYPSHLVAAQSSGYDLLDAVNQFRSANGLPPLRMDSSIMAAAQAHSEYQAAAGSWSHTGAGGSTSTQRAAAAGYGGGAAIRCTENVAVNNKGASYAVDQWQDAVHLAPMLSTLYTDAGAGAAADASGMTYYTLNVCYLTSSPGSAAPAPVAAAPPASSGSSQSEAPAPASRVNLFQVNTAEPEEDGSIIHVVQAGENPYTIASGYGIREADLIAQNNLGPNPVIYPGQRLFIRPAFTPTPTIEATLTPTPTRTHRPTQTPTQTPNPIASHTPVPLPTTTQTATPEPAFTEVILSQDPVLLLIGFLVVSGAALMLFGAVLRGRA
jgi:LysM repeat protein